MSKGTGVWAVGLEVSPESGVWNLEVPPSLCGIGCLLSVLRRRGTYVAR